MADRNAVLRMGEESERDAGAAKGVNSGVFSEKLAQTAVLSWEERCRGRVFAALVCLSSNGETSK